MDNTKIKTKQKTPENVLTPVCMKNNKKILLHTETENKEKVDNGVM